MDRDKIDFYLVTNYTKTNMSKQRIIITFKEEISDHGGYCSDNENEYTERTYTKEVLDTELNPDLDSYLCYADKIDFGNRECQSYYCTITNEAREANLGPHDYRITVLKAELIDK
ncbi:hypothetical protein EB001_13305 [bacterium]|nr:hypothetical protein [bacterium]